MASGEGPKGIGEISGQSSNCVEEIVPSTDWKEDSHNHYLQISLPGFNKDELRLDVNEFGYLTVSGERLIHYDKYIYFHQSFKLPGNSNIEEITGRFEGDTLLITVPKKSDQETEPPDTFQETKAENNNNCIYDDDDDDIKNDNNNGSSIVFTHGHADRRRKEIEERVKQTLKKKEKIILTAALAFSLGVIVLGLLSELR